MMVRDPHHPEEDRGSDLPARGSHIHLIAICGVGMASLAGLLQSQGYRVTGSDQHVYPPMSTYLEGLRIPVLQGFSGGHLRERPELVVIGNAVSRNNPEVEAVLRLEIPYVSFPQSLGRFLIGPKRSIVIAGTHGKTTTTALLAWVLSRAGWEPSFFIGGIPIDFDSGFKQGRGDWAVLEGDEYDSAFFDKGPKFLHYKPEKVILTSVEFDHADIYRDLAHLKEAFQRLAEMIPPAGALLACSEYEAGKEVAARARCPVTFYGDREASDWQARNIRVEDGGSLFEPCYRGRSEGAVKMRLLGRHNVSNALAVYAMGRELGIEREVLRDGLASFSGVKRRQELKGEVAGITVIDDFAHHPTAVKGTIEAVRAGYPGRRLWAIFEPRSNTSRRRIFAREFAQALSAADRVIVAGLYQPEKIPEPERLPAAEVVRDINRLCGDSRALFIEKAGEIPAHVAGEARAGDVILVMSNGGFDGVQEKILRLLEEKSG
ncbi:MAG: UDP-N-acetylmuramate:L-alanyl-gamma-D-glutamyl-meso-diaminopimelate ligase [Deltaproteobacteria bacterium]|nr:UDP-N-acetylmuramate:L-alanyl-gamma-D-glutamyl-meso-diaminopimelate ligase [Deltaproteobacteria bacterium]